MDRRARIAFALVVLAQAVHSIEECVFRLFDVFAPARWVSGLVGGLFGASHATGFTIANVAIVLFGVWCYWARVRTDHPGARAYAWFWAGLEGVNGLVHITVAIARGGYFPGVATAPLLLAASGYLAVALVRSRRATR